MLKLVSLVSPFCLAGCSTYERGASYRAVERKREIKEEKRGREKQRTLEGKKER
jgi:hypothetical protein